MRFHSGSFYTELGWVNVEDWVTLQPKYVLGKEGAAPPLMKPIKQFSYILLEEYQIIKCVNPDLTLDVNSKLLYHNKYGVKAKRIINQNYLVSSVCYSKPIKSFEEVLCNNDYLILETGALVVLCAEEDNISCIAKELSLFGYTISTLCFFREQYAVSFMYTDRYLISQVRQGVVNEQAPVLILDFEGFIFMNQNGLSFFIGE